MGWPRVVFSITSLSEQNDWGTDMKPSPARSRLRGPARRGAAACRALFAVAAFGILSACEQNSFVPPPPPKVEVALPLQRPITRYLEATGNASPIKNVDLVARAQAV